VHHMLPVSLDCPFSIAPSIISSILYRFRRLLST
jgi:hypothetical protein